MKEIAPGVGWLAFYGLVNVYFVGEAGSGKGGEWVLVDTGMPGQEDAIRAAAIARYGKNAKPAAIYLTHGHSDHAGSAGELAKLWDVPVYAHRLELPYLTGQSEYPPFDPTVGGTLAFLGRLLPAPQSIYPGDAVRELPNGELPGLSGWEVVETPGHSPGQVAFFRQSDRTLLAGDALTTVNLDKLTDVLAKTQSLARPPSPSTIDWLAARKSLYKLAALLPKTLACGHGTPMTGMTVSDDLSRFAERFRIPGDGRYVAEPAITDANGVRELPPAPPDPLWKNLVGLAVLAAGLFVAGKAIRRAASGQPSGHNDSGDQTTKE